MGVLEDLFVLHHFLLDTITWFLVARIVLTTILGVMMFLDPVLCSLHSKWYHKLMGVGFFALAYSNFDRLTNRMVSLYHGQPIPANNLIDSELIFTIALFILVAVTCYDYWRNKERIALTGRRLSCQGDSEIAPK